MATAKNEGKPEATGPLKIKVAGVERVFDIDNPELPEWVDKKTVATGGFPYNKKLDDEEYEETLERLQIELAKLLKMLTDQEADELLAHVSSVGRMLTALLNNLPRDR